MKKTYYPVPMSLAILLTLSAGAVSLSVGTYKAREAMYPGSVSGITWAGEFTGAPADWSTSWRGSPSAAARFFSVVGER